MAYEGEIRNFEEPWAISSACESDDIGTEYDTKLLVEASATNIPPATGDYGPLYICNNTGVRGDRGRRLP